LSLIISGLFLDVQPQIRLAFSGPLVDLLPVFSLADLSQGKPTDLSPIEICF